MMKLYCFIAILLLSLSACDNGHSHSKDDGHSHEGEVPGYHSDFPDSTQQEFNIHEDSSPINIPNPE
jgi:hypothetical protein